MRNTPSQKLWIEFHNHYCGVCIQHGLNPISNPNGKKNLKKGFQLNTVAVMNYMYNHYKLHPSQQFAILQAFCNGNYVSIYDTLFPSQQLSNLQGFLSQSFSDIAISEKENNSLVSAEIMHAWRKKISKSKEMDFSVPAEIMETWRKKITKPSPPCEYCQDTNPCECQFVWNVDMLSCEAN